MGLKMAVRPTLQSRTITLLIAAAIPLLLIFSMAAAAWLGIFNFAADVPHSRFISSIIEMMRERSVHVRAASIKVPVLANTQSIVKGAGNYAAMCARCHLTPDQASTELSRGLYPAPPNLTKQTAEPAKAFWTIKHGIKASGMPAWGKSMSDQDIWDMVAFLQRLPKLDALGYQGLVDSSSGHSHEGAYSRAHVEPGGAYNMPAESPTQASHGHKKGMEH